MAGCVPVELSDVSRHTSVAVPAGPNASGTASASWIGAMATGGDGNVIGALTVPPDNEIVVSHAFEVFAVESVNGGPTAPPPGHDELHGPGGGRSGERAVRACRCSGCWRP